MSTRDRNRITKAQHILDFNPTICPYCGLEVENVSTHLSKNRCKNHKNCLKQQELISKHKWAIHDLCGIVMILQVHDGLALIENNYYRYLVPVTDLNCCNLADTLKHIETACLSKEQIQLLIGMLNNALINGEPYKFGVGVLVEGNRVEFTHMGKICLGRVKYKNGNSYVVDIEGHNVSMNINEKDIISIKD